MGQTPMRWFLVFLCVVAVAVAVALERAQLSERSQFSGGTLVPGQPATDFALKTPDGAEFRLSRHRGEVVLLSFGYTFCPDVCPTTLAELAQVRARLGEAGKRV